MDPAAPGAVLLACSDDEAASRLARPLAEAGWQVHRARSCRDVYNPEVEFGLVTRLGDQAAFLAAWRRNAASRYTPVLLLGERPDPAADAFLPIDAPTEVLLEQALLLARLRRAERDSRSQRARLQEILDQAPVAVSVKDQHGRYLLVNRFWEEAFGRLRREVLGRTVNEVFPAEQAAHLAGLGRAAIESGRLDYEEVMHQSDGPHTYLKCKFALPDGARTWMVCGIATDITARKRAELALRDSEALYSSLVENLPVGIFRKDSGGRFTFVNTPFCAELGRKPSEIVGRTDHDFYPPEMAAKYAADDQQVISSGSAFECVEQHETPEGGMRYVQVIKAPVRAAHGGVIGMQGIFWDVTDRKRAQEELARAAAEGDIARRVQRKLFPSPRSSVVKRAAAAGYELAGASYPVEAVGGDYYDFFDLGGGKCLGVAVGDVAGHGVAAALLMAMARSYLHAAARREADPGALLTEVNGLLMEDIEGDRYITLVLLRIDVARRTVSYTSAGHATAYVLDARDKIKHTLDSTGPPLGVHAGCVWETSAELPLECGDRVVLLTDGIVEARDPGRQTFGMARVLDLMRVYRWASAAELVDNLYHGVRAYGQNEPVVDDITAVVIRIGAPPPSGNAGGGARGGT